MSAPELFARLTDEWPAAEPIILPDTGHTSADASMVDAIVSATDRLAACEA